MNITLSFAIRILLLIGSVGTFLFAMRYIRRSKVRIEDTLFWILLSIALIVLSVFPNLALHFAMWFKVQSPINFVFLFIIFLRLVKQFFTSLKLSQMEIRVAELAQRVAINEADAAQAARDKQPREL